MTEISLNEPAKPRETGARLGALVRSKQFARVVSVIVVLVIASFFRFQNLDWDGGKLLHPDERYVSVVTGQIGLPASVGDFLDPEKSKANPFNTDWGRTWVYGTLPLFGVRALAEALDSACGPRPFFPAQVVARALIGERVVGCGPRTFSGSTYLVGRLWSSVLDILSVLLVLLFCARLFGWRAGFLASVFAALTVFQIQIAHFYTVDSSTTFFTLLSLYFCARIVSRPLTARGLRNAQVAPTAEPSAWQKFVAASSRVAGSMWFDAVLVGLTAGMALANKPSAWQIVPAIVIAIFIALMRDRRPGLRPAAQWLIALVVAGACTFGAFRVFQPYAFVGGSTAEWDRTLKECGKIADKADVFLRLCNATTKLPSPLRELTAISSRWARPLSELQGVVEGDQDMPFSQQWANRMDYAFPFTNLVFWGLGLALGITSTIGLLYMISRLLRGRRYWAYLIPTVWIAGNFLYYAGILGKTMRYLLPIYPMMCVAASVVLIALWRNARTRHSPARDVNLGGMSATLRPIRFNFGSVVIAAVVLGTLIWAWAFSSIYRHPVTRLEASRWFMENVPSAVSVTWANGPATGMTNLQVKDLRLQAGKPQTFNFRLGAKDDAAGSATQPSELSDIGVRLNKTQGVGSLTAKLLSGGNVIGESTTPIVNGETALAFAGVALSPSREYQLVLDATGSPNAQLSAKTTTLASEHWDDAVPTSMGGRDPGWYYNWLKTSSDGQIQNYGDDTPQKLQTQLNWLDETDYLTLSSNRLYASIPRIPNRYPATTEYYRALFSGELGFELVADFQSFPRLGPLVFNDQELPQPLKRTPATQGTPLGIEVPYPAAEEAFSVYDHPRVLIFKKTPEYSRQNAERILGKYDLTRIVRQTPNKASTSPRGLLFDETTILEQQAGGTWSELFPRASLLNQSPALAVLAWLALIVAIGLFTLPILALLTRDGAGASTLMDAGYAIAKPVGLLLVTFIVWWLASLKLAEFSSATIWLIAGALAALGAACGYFARATLVPMLRARWRMLVAVEIVFFVAFGAWLLVRMGNPDLWHPAMGGEKPMDFAYLNGVLRSTYFPPIDPWFANGYINYYYFGFALIATPIKALGIDPAVAYNLAVPTLFAFTACGAFGVAATLYRALAGRRAKSDLSDTSFARGAIVAGVVAAVFAVALGNLDQINTVWPAFQRLGNIDRGAPPLQAALDGVGKWLAGAELPVRPEWPYWNATRLAKEPPIAEFPNFTFLYADLHAHMIGMPFALASMALALAFAAGARRWWAIILGAVVVGALWPINTWDFPVYFTLCAGAFVLASVQNRRLNWLDLLQRSIPRIVVFFVLTRALYAPYLEHFGSAYNSIEPYKDETTLLNTYITVYGLFLLPIGVYLVARFAQSWFMSLSESKLANYAHWVTLIVATLGALVLVNAKVKIAPIAFPLLVLSLFMAVRLPFRSHRFGDADSNRMRLAWLLSAGAFALSLFVELFTLKGDIGRMNTVFKFYIQIWLILSIVAAPVLLSLLQILSFRANAEKSALKADAPATDADPAAPTTQRARRAPVWQIARVAFVVLVGLGVFLAALYPAFAIPAKMRDRYVPSAPQGLDGMAYMPLATRIEGPDGVQPKTMHLSSDYEAIKWLQDNVVGSPTIFEGTTGGWGYRWGNRFSIYTGLPSVVGWEWHQRQQRSALSDSVVFDRQKDVAEFYNTTDINRALKLLRRYGAKYVIAGQLESAYYNPNGMAKFQQMERDRQLEQAYHNAGTTIYRVNESALK